MSTGDPTAGDQGISREEDALVLRADSLTIDELSRVTELVWQRMHDEAIRRIVLDVASTSPVSVAAAGTIVALRDHLRDRAVVSVRGGPRWLRTELRRHDVATE